MTMWTMIFLLGLSGMIIAAWTKHQESKQGIVRDHWGNPVEHTKREKELEDEVVQLRERVKVLERIAIDERAPRELSDEIERLRDR